MTSEQSTKPIPIKQAVPMDRRVLASTWTGMLDRCYNPQSLSFHNYGGRGIKIGDAWLKSFDRFASDMGVRPKGMSLDRINNDGNYENSNCRWASRTEQARNCRSNRWITIQGRTQLAADWAKESKIALACLRSRLRKGWSPAKAISTPAAASDRYDVSFRGKKQSRTAWAREMGLTMTCLNARLNNGWEIEKALLTPQRSKKCRVRRKRPLVIMAKEANISSACLRKRLDHYGWTPERALTTPVTVRVRRLTYQNRTRTLLDWSRETGIVKASLYWRLANGWSIERTLTTPVRKRNRSKP